MLTVLGDLHLGARNDSVLFRSHQKRFLEEVFWPAVVREDSRDLIVLGDLFDRGRTIATETLAMFNELFVRPIEERDMMAYVLVGNHDITYRDTLTPNVINELLGTKTNNFRVLDHPAIIDDNNKFKPWLALPWICADNRDEITEWIECHEVRHIFGHLEVTGGAIGGGRVFEGGLSPSVFKKYKHVYSGHFHCRSAVKTVEYLSTPLDLTWGEAEEWHGFHFMNDKLEIVKSVETPWRIHNTLSSLDNVPDIKGALVRLEYSGKLPEKDVETLRLAGAYDIRAINTTPVTFEGIDADEVLEIPATRSLVQDYIEADKTITVSKKHLSAYLDNIYSKASKETAPEM